MTVGEKYRECIKALEGHSDSPALDVSFFFQEICSLSRSDLILHSSDSLDTEKERKIDKFISLRLKGDPVAYILGHKGFYKSEFYTPRNVLVPQPDTEILVENTISVASSFSPEVRILDLCAGTGCVGISSALEISGFSDVELTLSDISEDAFSAFSKNASKLLPPSVKVKLLLSDLFDGVEGEKFHIIASNPPYIRSSVIESLPAEVKAEPRLALDGGEDGLALICKMVSQAPDYLEDGGYLLLETGYDQGEDVKKIMEGRGFASVEIKKDLGGRDRVVLGHM
ncbi:MAG: peptide chain release factor N(5)-glutamine methyltransferase [Sphaerochaetaceae bacterium]|nr:peptide chain release factor N(5)-glutamine methyltransferase [Sphaerochaetaceae bacterium]